MPTDWPDAREDVGAGLAEKKAGLEVVVLDRSEPRRAGATWGVRRTTLQGDRYLRGGVGWKHPIFFFLVLFLEGPTSSCEIDDAR